MEFSHLRDVPGYDSFVRIAPVDKGWSSDKKYFIETAGGEKLLLRVADISEYGSKEKELAVMRRIAALDIRMSQPVDFGVCDDGGRVFTLLTWCEGEEATAVLPTLTEAEQYELGREAGEILKKIHGIEKTEASGEWAESHDRKLDGYIESYHNCGMTFEGDTAVLRYIEKNRNVIAKRPQCLTHGDFHVGNLVISPEKELYVIDFQRCGMSDPYRAFTSIMFSAQVSPHFATGQIRGYFAGEPPEEFWGILAFYLAAIAIHALPWALGYGQKEIEYNYQMIKDILRWYNNMNETIPTWYLKDYGDTAISSMRE